MNYSNIILHIPHAWDKLPENLFNNETGRSELIKQSKDLIDYHTDSLFSFAPNTYDIDLSFDRTSHSHFISHERNPYKDKAVTMVICNVCRTLCDVERMQNDPLERKKMGILFGGDERGAKFGIGKKTDEAFRAYYDGYHAYMVELLGSNSFPLLIDCHSFSSHSTKLVSMTQEKSDIDICIGFNEDQTRPSDKLLNLVAKHFEEMGYNVAINKPFSNAKTFDSKSPYHSIMIEVNKRLYMNEGSLQIEESGFYKLNVALRALYRRIIEDNEIKRRGCFLEDYLGVKTAYKRIIDKIRAYGTKMLNRVDIFSEADNDNEHSALFSPSYVVTNQLWACPIEKRGLNGGEITIDGITFVIHQKKGNWFDKPLLFLLADDYPARLYAPEMFNKLKSILSSSEESTAVIHNDEYMHRIANDVKTYPNSLWKYYPVPIVFSDKAGNTYVDGDRIAIKMIQADIVSKSKSIVQVREIDF